MSADSASRVSCSHSYRGIFTRVQSFRASARLQGVTLPSGLRALESRPFRIYFAGMMVSQVCSWMQTVTQSWLVLQLTNSPFLLGLIATLQFGPILLFSVFAGILADRLVKRNILIFTQAVQCGLALTLAALVWSGHVRYWTVAIVAVMWGVMSALDQPTRQSFILELVGRQHLASAVGMNSASFNSARIIGPAVAGVLIARVGLFMGFLLNGLAFFVSITALTRLPALAAEPARGRRPRPRRDRRGRGYALRTPAIRFVLGLQLIVSFCVFNFSVYVPLLASEVLGLGAEGFGFLMTALGIGAVAAGLSLGAFGAQPPLTGPRRWGLGCLHGAARAVGGARRLGGRPPARRGGLLRHDRRGRLQHVDSARRARWPARPAHEPLHADLGRHLSRQRVLRRSGVRGRRRRARLRRQRHPRPPGRRRHRLALPPLTGADPVAEASLKRSPRHP